MSGTIFDSTSSMRSHDVQRGATGAGNHRAVLSESQPVIGKSSRSSTEWCERPAKPFGAAGTCRKKWISDDEGRRSERSMYGNGPSLSAVLGS